MLCQLFTALSSLLLWRIACSKTAATSAHYVPAHHHPPLHGVWYRPRGTQGALSGGLNPLG